MDIKTLAAISGLTFTDKEYEKLAKDFKSAIDYVAPILNANPPDISIYPEAVAINDLRADVKVQSLPIDKALKNAAKKRGRYFVVPQVVE